MGGLYAVIAVFKTQQVRLIRHATASCKRKERGREMVSYSSICCSGSRLVMYHGVEKGGEREKGNKERLPQSTSKSKLLKRRTQKESQIRP